MKMWLIVALVFVAGCERTFTVDLTVSEHVESACRSAHQDARVPVRNGLTPMSLVIDYHAVPAQTVDCRPDTLREACRTTACNRLDNFRRCREVAPEEYVTDDPAERQPIQRLMNTVANVDAVWTTGEGDVAPDGRVIMKVAFVPADCATIELEADEFSLAETARRHGVGIIFCAHTCPFYPDREDARLQLDVLNSCEQSLLDGCAELEEHVLP